MLASFSMLYLYERGLICVGLSQETFKMISTCVDQDSFDKVCCCCFFVCFIFSLMREEGSKYNNQRAIIGPPSKRHLNEVSRACPTLNAGLVAL